jgi:antirestriction protein ArdC
MSARKSTPAPKVDVYQDVTDRIIAQLEAGTIPWRKPWRCVDGTTPRNLVSGKPYRGINLLLLSMTPYASPYWMTFKQAQSKGGRVRKGEKSTLVVFWRMLKVEDPAAPKGFKTIPMLRHYRIFNVEQCDGIDVPEPAELPDFDPIDECEAIWSGFKGKPPVSFGGDSACYMPQLDAMRMPVREGFASPQAFYLTLFHESIHSTGHPSRLGRFAETDGPQAFGSESYAKEELVAEMGSAMLGTVAGLDPSAWLPQSAAYIASWLKSLRNDPKMVVGAAGKAQRAAEHILGTSDDGSDHEDVQPVKPSPAEPAPVVPVKPKTRMRIRFCAVDTGKVHGPELPDVRPCPGCGVLAHMVRNMGSCGACVRPVAKPAPAAAKGKRGKVKSMGAFASMLAVPEGQLQAWRNLMGRDPGLDVPVGLSVEYRGRSMRFDSGSVPLKTLKLALS